MAKINILDSSIYNQISAGEVVENPASIVKELVENSIDAGAQNITVMIEDGGIKSIQVVDDGEGIESEDLRKAVMPHATSKISSSSDLDTISTLGFRGEALPSIAAISSLEIKSKYFNADFASKLLIKGGVVVEEGVTSLSKGTSIEVTSLFYNTPARYKFLKSKKSEEELITRLMANFIVSNPNTGFKYYIEKKLVYASSGLGLEESAGSIFDKSIIENLLPLTYEEKPYKIDGFIGRPSSPAIKSNRLTQTIIINGRIINDMTVSAVVQNAYGENLMKRTFPVFILDIIIPFELVDVNTHPNKREVRFASPHQISSLIYKAVKNALNEAFAKRQSEFSSFSPHNKKEEIYTDEKNDFLTVQNNINSEKNLENNSFIEEKAPNEAIDTQYENILKNDDKDYFQSDLAYLSKMAPVTLEKGNFAFKESIDKNSFFNVEEKKIQQKIPDYKIIGQAFDTYIIVESGENLYYIDQHATHERLLYDNYIKKITAKVEVQDLMIPYIYEIKNNYDFIIKNLELFSEMGFEMEEFGDNLIKISAVPLMLCDLDMENFMDTLSEQTVAIKNIEGIAIIKDKIAKIACKSAIKGGDTLNKEDISIVLDYFFKNGVPLQCPHGRPTIVSFSRTEIEKTFRRII